jgi:hypothetical protein
MSWGGRLRSIQIGDTVSYSPEHLRQSGGLYTPSTPKARGTVQALIPRGEIVIAVVNWDQPHIPSSVNVKILTLVRQHAVG